MTAQTMSRNVAAAPPFRNCWTHFGSLTGAQIMYTIHCFEAWEVRIPTLQTVCELELKWRSYSCLKMNAQSISGNFATAPPFRRVFRSCETTLWHTSGALQHRTPILQLWNGLWKSPSSTKSSPRCGNDLQASKWLRNHLQAIKMTCKMKGGLWKHLAKPREVVKMPKKAP